MNKLTDNYEILEDLITTFNMDKSLITSFDVDPVLPQTFEVDEEVHTDKKIQPAPSGEVRPYE